MRARVWIEQEVEVEVSPAAAVEALQSLPEPEQSFLAVSGINACYGYLKRIPDASIAGMTDKQREIIANGLQELAERFRRCVDTTVTKA